MSELCLSSPPKTARVSSLLLSDLLLLLLSSILSHPIYFFYFIFFSPYLLKLLSFLSPLFVTTSLLLLGFLSLSPGLLHDHSPLEPEEPNKFHLFEELEAFQIAFEVAELRSDEAPVLNNTASTDETSSNLALGADFEEKTVEIAWEEKRLEGLLKELDEFEKMDYSVEEKKLADAPDGVLFDKDKAADEEIAAPTRGSEAKVDKVTGHGTVKVGRDKDREREKPSKPARISQTFDQHEADDGTGSELFESPRWEGMGSNLGSYGSMRRDKEWKKTLACKLFEERQNVDGSEGMDLLWETYEADSSSNKANGGKGNNAQKKKRSKKKSQAELYNDDDDEAEDMDGQLCCLQALKFSTGKMNLGRPNMLKISKAFKGIGWLHHVTRQAKKALHN